ncbi:MAG: hypothetical protein M1352_02165 [Patescibacteria group bacterium]|nr:hypothetical protein [Patescibacteria group bacterium]
MDNDLKQKIRLITQSLAAAQASLELARGFLAEISGEPLLPPAKKQTAVNKPVNADLPGVIGTFDGENMVAADGKKYAVPVNYASKSGLVFGDKLKMTEAEGGKIFKQIERVKRQRVSGILSRKTGQWFLATSDGSHKVLEVAVNYFKYGEGQEVFGLLPRENLKAPFAALEPPLTKFESGTVKGQAATADTVEVKKAAAAEPKVTEKVKAKIKPVRSVKTESKELKSMKVGKEPDNDLVKTKTEKEETKTSSPAIGDEDLR